MGRRTSSRLCQIWVALGPRDAHTASWAAIWRLKIEYDVATSRCIKSRGGNMGSLAYLASNMKKVMPRTKEAAMRDITKGEVHDFPWPGKSTASRKVAMAELVKIAPKKSIRPSFEVATPMLGACISFCSVEGFSNPQTTNIIASIMRGTWQINDLQMASAYFQII